ncbi:MAG: AI-2E family transporter [Sphingobacteriales bacterium]|nr:MAG: AI-2E family transporter [Sphingobacteriales bacterium]
MPTSNYPAYKKAVVIHVWIILIIITLYFLENILVPLGFAALLAVLLNPVNNWLQRKGFSCLVAVSITVTVTVLITIALMYFLGTQVALFADSVPKLKQEFGQMLYQAQNWLAQKLNLRTPGEIGWLRDAFDKSFSGNDEIVSQTLGAITAMAVVLTLIPVYVFLLLLYRDLILKFLMRVFLRSDPAKVSDILHETQGVIQSYVMGLMIETVIIAVLNSAGLLLLGVPYAILLGVLGALLNMVPYIGGVIATALAVMMAMVGSNDLVTPLLVVTLYGVVQFIDNNLIVPKIVAGRVKINAIISIVAVIAGGELWGVSGMFLSIPFVAILKIIFDRIESLKPWGMLMGIEYPEDPSQINASSTMWEQNSTITIVPPAGEDVAGPDSAKE